MKHVLLIEPGFYSRVQLDDELAPYGFMVTSVKQVNSAIIKMKTQVFHLLLMSYDDDIEGGLRLLAALREAFNPLPVVMMTKKPTEDQLVRLMQFRPVEVIVKPYSLLDLVERMETMIQARKDAKD